ncbi:plastocyanin/azurin family copper-binding protein [Burkholderia sp. BCC1999]|uniref:plastocyanin/azurin family copper-binding protein n=1 Tax=Burkholderia sp. BCC1999 TaxID=2817448 RepID=UPI002AC34CA3|nr:plastocyanin/azurin family copper-binding protein [Burkholderia sp. BCC1999]
MRVVYRIAGVVMLCTISHAGWAQQSVKATLLSNSIKLETHSVKAGRIKLVVANTANNNMEHELVVFKTNLDDNALPVSKEQVLEYKLTKIGEVEDIAPGKTKSASFRLTPGRYVLICNKPGHYAAGMHTVLAVTP